MTETFREPNFLCVSSWRVDSDSEKLSDEQRELTKLFELNIRLELIWWFHLLTRRRLCSHVLRVTFVLICHQTQKLFIFNTDGHWVCICDTHFCVWAYECVSVNVRACVCVLACACDCDCVSLCFVALKLLGPNQVLYWLSVVSVHFFFQFI